MPMLIAAALLSCTVTDGDTLRCGPPGEYPMERVRLIGIDAPELPGHCQHGRDCASGDAGASTAGLQRLVIGKLVRLERHGTDRYGRTLAFAFVGRINLSCAQLRARQAVYVPRWDIGGRVRGCR